MSKYQQKKKGKTQEEKDLEAALQASLDIPDEEAQYLQAIQESLALEEKKTPPKAKPKPQPKSKLPSLSKQDKHALDLLMEEMSPPEPSSESKTVCGPFPWVPAVKASKGWASRAQNRPVPNLHTLCFRECGAGGDCMFYSIAAGFKMFKGEDPRTLTKADMLRARKWLADSITANNVNHFVHEYQKEKYGSYMTTKEGFKNAATWSKDKQTWSPDILGSTQDLVYRGVPYRYPIHPSMRTMLDVDDPNFQVAPQYQYNPNWSAAQIRQHSANSVKADAVKLIVQKPGWVYQGDDLALEYMVKGNNPIHDNRIGFMLLSAHGQISCEWITDNGDADYYMLLLNLPGHWQLAGVAIGPNKVQSVFPASALPELLNVLYIDDCMGK